MISILAYYGISCHIEPYLDQKTHKIDVYSFDLKCEVPVKNHFINGFVKRSPFFLSVIFFLNSYKEMINKKYKTVNILKQREHKVTEKAVDANEHTYILKSYDLANS